MNLHGLIVVLLWTSSHGVTADHSIMEMINTKRVMQMLSSTPPVNNDTNLSAVTQIYHNALADDDFPDVQDNSVSKKPKKGQRALIPDINAVLMDLSRPDRLLKSNDDGMLITKKANLRKDWCRTEPIIQKIREEGCQPKNIVNRFCYGQCNSFFIPKNIAPKKGKRKRTEESDEVVAFRSCGVCKPKKTAWVQVTLNCPGADPPVRRRLVNKVKQCQCMAQNVFR